MPRRPIRSRTPRRLAVLAAAAAFACSLMPLPPAAAAPASRQADGSSGWPTISSDGRFVTFTSAASNLVPGDQNGSSDVFVQDLLRRRTTLVTVPGDHVAEGSIPWTISGNGRSGVLEVSNRDDPRSDGLHVWETGCQPVQLSDGVGQPAHSGPYGVSISADGRYVGYGVYTGGTVAGGPEFQPFLRDRWRGTTELVAVNDAGQRADNNSGGVSVSGDGRWVAFGSSAGNLSPDRPRAYENLYLRDRWQKTTRLVSRNLAGQPANDVSGGPRLSGDGHYLLFGSTATDIVPGDTNAVEDLFVRDLRSGISRRVNVSSTGRQNDQGPIYHSLSANGRYVVFTSRGSVLAPVGTSPWTIHVYVRDLVAGTTELVDRSGGGAPADADSEGVPSISADGRYVVYASTAENLVAGDTNGVSDVFVRDRRLRTTFRVTTPTTLAPAP